ncbi:MAG: alpha-amylase family glycosyl hydrolase [Chthoniobacteraceae bacterium]
MTEIRAEDGCPAFTATIQFEADALPAHFCWGVTVDGPGGANLWGVPTEVHDANSGARFREFTLDPARPATQQDFYFTFARRLGARKYYQPGAAAPDLLFAVWAPNARTVEVVFGDPNRGYIADDGNGIDPTRPVVPLTKGDGGIWSSPVLSNFTAFEGAPYMYRIVNAQGNTRYRTDIFSRTQIGRGAQNPNGGHFTGTPDALDGTKSCSVVVSLDTVARDLDSGLVRVSEAEFWATEFTLGLAVPSRIEDLVIYELHVGSLGFGLNRPGNLRDAIALLDYLHELGVNAVELMPMSEFSGTLGWGYGDSHHFVIESSAGGRDDYKHFVRECHRRGIAVLQDVCYNHYDQDADRAQWQYDSEKPEENIYFWYEGANRNPPNSGYVNNGSSGWAPRYWEEVVRHQFVSSAAAFIEEFHVDGLRVDLTQAFHRDNSLNDASGRQVTSANQFGTKLLREWSRTLRMIKPAVMLIAEDHSEWDKVTQSPDLGGLGFGATWFAAFYHHLIGDSDMAGGKARLIKTAGGGSEGPLDFSKFASALYDSQYNKVVYHESHDEAGNAGGTERTMPCAVGGAALIGETRRYAEARSRVAFALSLFSAGTPMFFMAEEVAAQQPYRVMGFIDHREDLRGERAGNGAGMFRFYQDAIKLSRRRPAVRSQQIDIIHVNDGGRVLAFTRRSGSDQLLVIASLSNAPYLDGYVIQTDSGRLPAGSWREVFNSDAGDYGGWGVGNFGATVPVNGDRIQVRVPANGVLVFQRT